MEITVKRKFKGNNYTIGSLYIDDKYFCDTLEDIDRGLTDNMTDSYISTVKVVDQTAIPIGSYKVTITYSNRFQKLLPLINNVKGFSGIRIHSGNTKEDTSGCILVGFNTEKGKVVNSKVTFDKLFNILQDTLNNGEQVEIRII